MLTYLREQSVSNSVMLLTYLWISDDSDKTRIMGPIYSPLTDFLLDGKIPRGFINELLIYAETMPYVLDKVSGQYLG